MAVKVKNSKTKAHIQYKNKDGIRVPGVTTITGELGWSKQTLINWGNRMGLEGIDTKKYVDDKAAIGTLGHLIITDKLKGIKTNTDDFSKNQIDKAKNSVKSFEAWAKFHKIEPVFIEEPLVSNLYNFGGTIDIYGKIDGELEIVDLKTGSGIYDEHYIQVGGGYWILLEENEHRLIKARILNIPRANSERFDEKIVPQVECCKRIFLNCLENYKLHKDIKNDSDDFYNWIKEVEDKK